MLNKDEFKYFNCHVLTSVGDYFLLGASSFSTTGMRKRLLVHMVMRTMDLVQACCTQSVVGAMLRFAVAKKKQ
jgi:hypothetical protein